MISNSVTPPLEFVFQEQSYSSPFRLEFGLGSRSCDIDDPCGVIADFCGVIADFCRVIADYCVVITDFCGVIADPCGVVAIPEVIGDRCATH